MLSGFESFRLDRSTLGSGVLLVVHHSLSFHRLSSLPQLEIVSVEIGLVCPLLICVFYLPPCLSQEYFSEVLQYLESISSHPGLVLVGDFNFPKIRWSSLCDQSPQSDAFCDFVFRHNLIQVLNFPTHCKGNILDLVFSNSDSLVENISHFSPSFSTLIIIFFLFPSLLLRNPLGNQFSLSHLTSNKPTLSTYPLSCWTLTLVSCSPLQTMNLCGYP